MSQSLSSDFAEVLVDQLVGCGVRHFVICPGSRSAPLAVAARRHPEAQVLVHLDERSAAFLALGLGKQLEVPVALICTSGTAAAEFHPAVVEAFHSGVPLLLLTADRPPELHRVGANQSIDQLGIYGGSVRWAFDPGPPERLPGMERRWRRLAVRAVAEAMGPPAGPVQLNLPFREPLVTPGPETRGDLGPRLPPVRRAGPGADPRSVKRLVEALERSRRPMVVAGEMRRGERLVPALRALLAGSGAVILAEPSSQLRTWGLQGGADAYDLLLRSPERPFLDPPDLVLRLGATPTSKVLNQFLAATAPPLLLLDPEGRMADPESLATEIFRADPEALLAGAAAQLSPGSGDPGWRESWARASELARSTVTGLLPELPLFEAHAVLALQEQFREGTLWVGSSLPIRDVDAFWPAASEGPRFLGNRGASGIDGFVSTVMGATMAASPTLGLLGDLTLFHDLNGLWAARRHGIPAKLLLLDNDGGGVFSFLPQRAHQDVFEELFGTPLGFDLAAAARLHGFTTREATRPDELPGGLAQLLSDPGPCLLRLGFSRAASQGAHEACWAAVAEALASA